VSRTLLDTDVVVEYLRGRARAVEYLEDMGATPLLSAITVAELFAGARNVEETENIREFVSIIEVAEVDEEIAELGGGFLREYGPIMGTGLADALIAATSVLRGVPLMTFNARHYPMLDDVNAPYEREGT